MKSPAEVFESLRRKCKKEWKTAFLAAVITGLLVHMPILLSDIPNHDGLASMYFDQNMITSGRWFLMIACGLSSYFTLPWVIGLLGIFFLGLTAVVLTELLEIKNTSVIILTSGLLVTFPALASTFAYVFTLDGYMLAMFLAVLAVLFTRKYRLGFVPGAVCLAFSMGTYQAYLPFAILLCIYVLVECFIDDASATGRVRALLHYPAMGILGMGIYFAMLFGLLRIQGKELASYQGINHLQGALSDIEMAGGVADATATGLIGTLGGMYRDFFSFTLKGGVLFGNLFSGAAICLLTLLFAAVLVRLVVRRKWWRKPLFFVVAVLLVVGLPLATNVIQLISPELNYHLLMRYQWILYPICMLAFIDKYGIRGYAWDVTEKGVSARRDASGPRLEWGLLIAAAVLLFQYAIVDNIAYSNLQKRYEKTYAYCVRLLDRIEQTPGYYQGIPVAMIGVVGDEAFPPTDITGDVTGGMIGIAGDSLLYTGANYEAFVRNYLGATLNILESEVMGDIYYSEEYMAMESFPAASSTKVVDGVLYVKTENMERGGVPLQDGSD